ncbi:MAG: hypothetical protein IPP72_10105 [Chitinophagaceae bacterium]|nr:hypothetical protein [Chitinophagaceae bacterium]
MKKLLTLLAVFAFIAGAKAQYVDIPDSSFRNYLKTRYPSCFNAAGQMDTTCSEINTAITLRIPQNSGAFKNIEGVQYFKSLDSLILISLSIDTINTLPPLIKYLDLSFNSLQGPSFPVIPNSVTDCYLQGISRSQLPALPNSITHLDLTYSSITIISQLPASLEYFNAMPAYLRFINSFPNTTKTIIIDGSYWRLSLPTLPDSLIYLHTKNIATLPALPENLQTLICTDSLRVLPALPNNLRHLDLRSLYFLQLPSQFPDSLRYLNIDRNGFNRQILSLPSKLEYFSAYQSGISGSFPAMPNTLRYVNMEYNNLSGFSTLSDSLEYFNFNNNQVSQIPVLPSGLDTLICYGNLYSNLPSVLPTDLKELICGTPTLSNLPPLPTGLLILACGGTQISNLPTLPNGLRFLGVSNNRLLTTLPTLPDSLRELACSNCSITSLPDLPKPLIMLNCDHNPISFLPALPDSMFQLLIDSTDIHCLPKIPKSAPFNSWEYPGRLHISMDESKITCIPNLPERVNINWRDTYPICNPVNNVNHCAAFPQITGTAFIDQNNNGTKDPNENYKSNLKVELSNGSIAYTNNNGYFEIGADSLGSYTITPAAPDYYNIVPSSATYNFTTYDTIVLKDYALQANSTKDSLAIKLTAVSRARPGFSFPYLISYENAGTTNLSPSIVFNYDDTKLTYDSSSNAAVVNNGNNLSLSAGSFLPGQQGNFTAYFKVKTTAALGDSLLAKATISDNAVAAADSNQTVIRGAYDPNDKQATPELSPLQIANGTYIDYTIRFQNTGNDTAFNVVISDTLAAELLANTLEVFSSSHNCKTTVKDNIVFFEFLNILLPDSNTNEMKSHGFVSFRIKPHPSVPSGSTINNNAAIYFDYNVPVITNTAATYIKPFTIIPLKLISFSAIPQTDNSTTLFWNTASEINTKQFVIEQSNNGLNFNSLKTVVAKGRASNNYSSNIADFTNSIVYYRLEIVDNDGSFSYSPTIKIDRRKNTSGFISIE